MRKSEIQHQMKMFSRLNPRTHTTDDLSIRLGTIVQPFLTMLMGASFNTIYRGRIHKDSSTYFTNTSDLWYPPNHKVTRLGRFNDINESIFYASGHYVGAAKECSIKNNDVITIITCQKKPSNPLQVANMFTDKLKKNNEFIMNVKSIDASPKAHDILQKVRNKKIHKAIQQFLEDLALLPVKYGEECKYKFSICVKNLFFAIPELDGLCYPPLDLDGKNINFALRPEVADRHYEVIQAIVLRYDEKTEMLNCINKSSSVDPITGAITYLKR